MPNEIFRIRHRHFSLLFFLYLHCVMILFSKCNRNENKGS